MVRRLRFVFAFFGLFLSSLWSLDIQVHPGQIYVGTRIQLRVQGPAPQLPDSATWNMGDTSPSLTGLTVEHEYKDPGNYSVQCTLPTGERMTRYISVQDRRVITASPASPMAGAQVNFVTQFFARGQVRWNFGDGVVQNGPGTISHTFSSPGSFEIKAYDYNGQSTLPVKITITVAANNRTLILSNGPAKANFPVEFRTGNFPVSTLQWIFGDGNTQTGGATIQHTYRNPGNYTVTAKIPGSSDGSGKTLLIQVGADPRRLDAQPRNPGKYEGISFQATGFPAGDLVWKFGDGTQRIAGHQVRHSYDQLGNFSVSAETPSSSASPVTTQIRIQMDRRQLKLLPESVQVGGMVRIQAINVTADTVNWKIGTLNLNGRPKEISHRFIDPGVFDVQCVIPGQTPLTSRIRVMDTRRIVSSPRVVFAGSKVTLTLMNGKGPGIRWELPGGIIRNGDVKLVHEFNQPGRMTVKAYDFNGTAQVPVLAHFQVIADDRKILPEYKTIYAGARIGYRAFLFKDGSIQWDFGDGTQRMGPVEMSHVYASPGQYRLKAVDFRGNDGKSVILDVVVHPENRKILYPDRIRAGERVDLKLLGVTGNDFSWRLGASGSYRGSEISGVLFPRAGRVPILIEDPGKRYPPLQSFVMVQPDSRKVSAPRYVLPGDKVVLNAVNFDGPQVEWKFGDGSAGVKGAKSITHTYSELGNFTYSARDNGGASSKEFSGRLSVVELSPKFTLQYVELAFATGKAYSVIPLKNRPPGYSLRMRSSGRGILRGKWKLDNQTMGLFTMVLRDGETAVLKRSRTPKLPVLDVGLHSLSFELINYQFSGRIPTLRYFVSAGGAIRLLFPKPGEKIKAEESVLLKWKPERKATQYEIAVSAVPFQFLSDRHISWRDAQKSGSHKILMADYGKAKWIYWLVRGKNASGRVITTSEVGSFRVISE